MKKSLVMVLVGTVALGAALVFTRTGVTAPAGAGTPPRTRVALVNLTYVFKWYDKYIHYQKEMKDFIKTLEEPVKTKQKQLLDKRRQAQLAQTPADKEKFEQEMKVLKREVEDLQASGRKQLAEKSKQIVTIYKEVQTMAQKHALSNNFDLVLQFQDAAEKEEINSPGNILRKLRSPGVIPMYWQQNMDISWHVVNSLNAAYRAAGGKR